MNPNIKNVVNKKLGDKPDIFLVPPVSYPAFVWLMQQSFLIVTDSGGIQEEAPTLGKPVIVTRDFSERTEGVEIGYSTLVGTDQKKITQEIHTILNHFEGMDNKANPYDKGDASRQIVDYLLQINSI